MSKYLLRCPEKNQYRHIQVCREKCPKHDHCEARKDHEINVLLDAEIHEMIMHRIKGMGKRN